LAWTYRNRATGTSKRKLRQIEPRDKEGSHETAICWTELEAAMAGAALKNNEDMANEERSAVCTSIK